MTPPIQILFVCTGNICRSPMAEGLFRDMVKGMENISVRSAGVCAPDGQSPSSHAVNVMKELKLDITDLRSTSISKEAIQESDYILVMTYGHLDALLMLHPEASEKTFLLREFEPDLHPAEREVSDPIGGSESIYRTTRDQIQNALKHLLQTLKKNKLEPHKSIPEMNETPSLSTSDPEIFNIIQQERQRQFENIELIASENFTSKAVMEAQGSCLTNKYAEGYPAKRWYGGCERVDEIEEIAINRAKQLFGAEHANVQPHSGSQANQAVYFSVLKPGDKILTMDLSHGGHLTHGHPMNFSGKLYEVSHYGVSKNSEEIDYDALMKQAQDFKPQMITVGASAYSRTIHFDKMRKIADAVGAYLFADIAHIAGLVAAGEHPSPISYADFVTTTTHKTLRGPRGGLILCKQEYAKGIDSTVFPGCQGGPLMHVIAAKAVCFAEALRPEFKDYQSQVIKNAKALSEGMKKNGYRVVSGTTDNHVMLIDLQPKVITGKEAQEALDHAAITVNKNAIPYDTQSPFKAGGIRLGTPAVTTRGMKEDQMFDIANWIHQGIENRQNAEALAELASQVKSFSTGYPLPY